MVAEVNPSYLRSSDKIMVTGILDFKETINHSFNKIILSKALV